MSKPPKVDFKALVAAGGATPIEAAVALESAAPAPQPTAEVVELTQPTPEPTRPAARKEAAKQAPLKKRSVQQTLYLDQQVHDQLRELAFHERKAMHGLVLEGLDLLFKKRGLKSLAQLGKLAS